MISSIELSQGLLPIESIRVEPIERRNNIYISGASFHSLRGLNHYLVDQVIRADATPEDERYSLKDVSVRIVLEYCDGTQCKITIDDLSSITDLVLNEGKKFNIGFVLYRYQEDYVRNLREQKRTVCGADSLHIMLPDWSTLCALDNEIEKTQRFLSRYDLDVEV